MARRILRTVWPYLAGTASVAFLIWASFLVRRYWHIQFDPTFLIIMLMIATAWYGGLGPGLVIAVGFEVALEYFAYPPRDPVRAAVIAFNRLLLFISVVVFASARRGAEQRLKQHQRSLEEALAREREARREAEGANRVKDEFLATVSHELRTPLNAMVGWATLLARHQTDRELTRKAAATIERNARAQAHIVNDILDMTRIAAGGLRIAPRRIELAPVIEEALDQMRLAAKDKAIEIGTQLEPAVLVDGDADRLRQIAWNLVYNAIKFTQPGGRIDVALRRDGTSAVLTVSDDGIGIAAEFVPHLFERFQQADGSTNRERAGLGLGLAIVRSLVELHGGTVTADSGGKDKGTTFTVTLPLAIDIEPVVAR